MRAENTLLSEERQRQNENAKAVAAPSVSESDHQSLLLPRFCVFQMSCAWARLVHLGRNGGESVILQ